MTTYTLSKTVIERGSYKNKEDMQMKLDVLFAGNRITSAEYEELTQLLIAK